MIWFLSSPFLPIRDYDTPWSDEGVASEVIESLLPIGDILPAPDHHWAEMKSDSALSRLAFRSLGAWNLEGVELAQYPDVVWKADFSLLADFAVRDGFERYGATAFFLADQSLHHIYWCSQERDIFPGDPEWAHAKWVWKNSMLVQITIVDHLLRTHWTMASPITRASREQLSAAHPIRRLMHPFTFRTITINHKSSFSLVPVKGFIHRTTAMTSASHRRLLNQAADLVEYETFPDRCRRQKVHSLGASSPPIQDGLEYWELIHAFVGEFIDNHYAHDTLIDDQELSGLWTALQRLPQSRNIGALSKEALVNYLTQVIWTVTGLHQYVGNPLEFILQPSFLSTKIRPGKEVADIQATLQSFSIIGLTGLPQTPLLGDYTHLVDDPEDKACLQRFQQRLEALAASIEKRNEARPEPFNSFNPRFMNCSVSI